jgi:hypothetical protein
MTDRFYERAARWFDEQPDRANVTYARNALAKCLREVAAEERASERERIVAIVRKLVGETCENEPEDLQASSMASVHCGATTVAYDVSRRMPLCASCMERPGVHAVLLAELLREPEPADKPSGA